MATTVPYPDRLNLADQQRIADILREAVPFASAEIATMLNVAADTIESMCDALKSQERLTLATIDTINQLAGKAS